ncbi:MAG: hypothetical protein WC815_23950 [Vicinamibacterales bacterium]|jgi:hypothetical protein
MTWKTPTVHAGTNGTAVTASVAIAKPAGVAIGDLLVLVVATEAAAVDITPPAGWTAVVAEITQDAKINLAVFTRFATHAEPATYTITCDAADHSLYNLFIVRGVDPWDVIHVSDAAQGDAVLPRPEPEVVTTVPNCLAVGVLAYDGSPRVIAAPAGWTILASADGPAGSISTGIATKAMAVAGSSGGANWTAGDASAGDYIALTFAITPGVMARAYSILYTPQQLLAKTLADCSEFRNLVGATTHAAAFARIWHESLPPPAAGARNYSLAEMNAYRPYAIVFTRDPDGAATTRIGSPGAWTDRGALWIRLVFDMPAGMDESPVLLDHLVKQLVGRLERCPSDETYATFKGLMDLAGTTNETDGYSYLAADSVVFKAWSLSNPADFPGQGDFIVATLEVAWGEGGAA